MSHVVKRREEIKRMDDVKRVMEKAKGYFDQGFN